LRFASPADQLATRAQTTEIIDVMTHGHSFGLHWIDLEDQRRAGGMLL